METFGCRSPDGDETFVWLGSTLGSTNNNLGTTSIYEKKNNKSNHFKCYCKNGAVDIFNEFVTTNNWTILTKQEIIQQTGEENVLLISPLIPQSGPTRYT